MLLDTSGLLALANAYEPQHSSARELLAAATRVVTHNYVIGEFIALATRRGLPRESVLEFVEAIDNTAEMETFHVDRSLHLAALGLLKERLDKQWSLCDAVSFILMERLKLKEALTTDHHFEQAGFKRLL
jgi:predicted nucleic acid-binding protein